MTRIFTAVAILALAGVAFGGYSLGFKYTEVPTYVTDAGPEVEDMYMLRFGAMASPTFRVEALLGYAKESFEEDVTDSDWDGSMFAVGGAGYYVIADPANTQFSFGGQVLYAKTTYEANGEDGPETSAFSVSPLMRIDFAIPGAERFAMYTEYGIRYASATTTVEGAEEDNEYKWSGYQTYSPMEILAGAYYTF